MKNFNKYIVPAEYAGITVKEYLKQGLNISGRQIQKLTRGKGILLNGRAPFLEKKLKKGDEIQVLILQDRDYGVEPEEGEVDILYEDEEVIVLNKPPGILVHPAGQTTKGTLANYLAFYEQKNNRMGKIRPLHRLDRDTSGCVLFARQAAVQSELEKQLLDGRMKRTYLAVVQGGLEGETGTVNAPIGSWPGRANRRQVRDDGERAVTHYQVVGKDNAFTLVRLMLETGRTHQIRVHMAYIGHPVTGDRMYGGSSQHISRQALHASEIAFFHPAKNRIITVEAPLPPDIGRVIDNFKSFDYNY